jgi:Cu(I)/Ag(I) efflux system membrane fusion protein
MKRSSLPLLMGAIIGTQALLNGVSFTLPPKAHTVIDHINFISVAHAAEAAAVKYTCPMHPQIISDTPGKCPICGMDLVPIAGGHSHAPAANQGDAPMVEIAPDNMQKMGVRTEKVTKSSFGQGIRATGIIMENERKRWDIFSQVEGRVTNLKVTAVGDMVKKGQPFYSLYSPELLALQNDYIAALSGGMKDIAAAARKRLKLLGVDEQVLNTLAKTRKAYDEVPFFIPADGVLNRLEIRNGHYLMTNGEIGHIQDLSTVWVDAAVPEGDLPQIKEGASATVIFTGNATPYDAKVDYIYPTITPEVRTGKVRLVVDNKDGTLKPAGYATVSFAAASSLEKVSVPSEAVLRSSTGNHVIVALGDGKFQARSVKTGAASGGKTEIIEGLKEDEAVVTSAQFLIDSESSLRESLNKLSGAK